MTINVKNITILMVIAGRHIMDRTSRQSTLTPTYSLQDILLRREGEAWTQTSASSIMTINVKNITILMVIAGRHIMDRTSQQSTLTPAYSLQDILLRREGEAWTQTSASTIMTINVKNITILMVTAGRHIMDRTSQQS